MDNLLLALITGLTTGGVSCFAVQGGLLATSLSRQDKKNQKQAVGLFLAGKIIGYSILGAFLGLLGSSIIISPKIQGWMQILAGVFMLLAVGRLLDLHPIFRRFVFTPPKSLFRLVRAKSLNEGLVSSSLLGFLTILIPCGVTQAMMLLAVSSGSIVMGSLIMFSFTVGTSPVFFALGLASSELFKHKSLKYVAGLAILTLALMSINTGQVLRGSAHTLQNYYLAATNQTTNGSSDVKAAKVDQSGNQTVNITVFSNGYESDVKTLKSGVPVILNLTSDNVQGCSRAFTIPEYNISKILPETGVVSLEFTPTKKGRLTYTCSMGMYTGWFDII